MADRAQIGREQRSGSEQRQRQRVLHVRLTDAEYATLEARAGETGLSMGSLVRAEVLGNAGVRAARRPHVDSALLARVLGQLGKIGSNANQLARAANTDRLDPDDEVPAQVSRLLAEIEAIRALVMQAMGRQP